MFLSASRFVIVLFAGALLALSLSLSAAAAQSGEPKGGTPDKEGQKKIDEYAEAARMLTGPAANAECVWAGRRVVSLLWRDDLDTANRHLELYDRFGCPGAHIQAAFRCVVKQGNIDPKAPESLHARVHACWINPNLPPAPAMTGTNAQ